MAISISTQARNAAGAAIAALVDSGTTLANGFMEIRTGTKPATPQDTASGILLGVVNFSNPAFGSFSNGVATANAISPDTAADNTGTAGWFRIYNRNSVAVMDGTITITGGGGDIEFDNVLFVAAGTIAISSLSLVMPINC